MKIQKMGTVIKYGALAIAMTVMATRAKATLTWSTPLTLSSPNLVGTVDGVTADANGSPATELDFALELLNLGPNQNVTITLDSNPSTTFVTTATTYPGAGGTIGTTHDGGTTAVPSGYEYAIAKYDGQNAGYILFYLGGQDATLPNAPANFFTTDPNQYGISGYTAFNIDSAVPEPATVFAGTLLLLPFGVSALRILRRKSAAA